MGSEVGYVKFDAIDGEIQEANHKKWSAIFSFSFGGERGTVNFDGRSGAAFNATYSHVTMLKGHDSASPALMSRLSSGQPLSSVKIDLISSIGGTSAAMVATYELKNAVVMSFSFTTGRDTGETGAVDRIVLSYEELKITYQVVDVDGKLGSKSNASWNIPKGTVK